MSKKKKIFLVILIVILVYIITTIIALYYIQPKLFFHPWHDEESYQALLKKENFEELVIDNNQQKLSGWFKKNTQDKSAPLVIMYGGNIQNSSHTCMRYLESDCYSYFDNYNFMIVDYPGYGLSEGKTSEKTMFEAAIKVYDYASQLENVDKNNIVLLGYSIGSGVATYVASQRNVNGLILIAPYDEILSVYNSYANIFHGPLKLLAKYRFESIKYAEKVKVSPLIVTSYDDEVINYTWSVRLADAFENVEKMIILDNSVKHADYSTQENVWSEIKNYLGRRRNENR